MSQIAKIFEWDQTCEASALIDGAATLAPTQDVELGKLSFRRVTLQFFLLLTRGFIQIICLCIVRPGRWSGGSKPARLYFSSYLCLVQRGAAWEQTDEKGKKCAGAIFSACASHLTS